MPQSMSKEVIRELATKHGFELCGFSRPQFSGKHSQGLDSWVNAEMHGEMGYMAEASRIERRKQPESMLDGTKTVISIGMRHASPSYLLEKAKLDRSRGVIAAYAHGDDYHEVMKKRLKAFARDLDKLMGVHEQRVYVDTAPVLEHALAEEGGLGWQGKHTLTINRELGSYLMLGEIFTTADIEPDEGAGFHCGSCTACIDICPTKAIVAPFVVDARLCISYLTIEYRGFIPLELRTLMGNRIFGCDDCQMACPWNIKAKPMTLDHLTPRNENMLPQLAKLFELDEEQFRKRFLKSPVKRSGRAGLLRNVAIAMGNSEDRSFLPLLLKALDEEESLIRGHSAWAIANIVRQKPQPFDGEIAAKLAYYVAHESDSEVLQELNRAIETVGESS